MDDDATIVRPENIEAMTLAELRDLHGRAASRIGELQAIEARSLTEARELRGLVALANEVASLVGEAVQPVATLSDLPVETPVETAPVEEAPVDEPEVEVEAPADHLALAHAASASLTAAQVAGQAASPSPSDLPGRRRASFVAAVGNGSVEAGQELAFDDMITPIAAVLDQARALSKSGRSVSENDRTVRIASISFRDQPDERLSPMNSAHLNTRIIREAQDSLGSGEERPSRTAAVCGPAEIIREIPECIGMMRPVRELFPQVPSERASFEFIPSIGLGAVAGGVTIWDDADQALVDEADPLTWKPCVEMVCANTVTETPSRIPSCMTVETMQSLSAPEQIENWIATLSALTERAAEGELLRRIDALSSNYTIATSWYGALTSMYNTVATLLGMAGDLNRQVDLSNYVLILPNGLTRFLGLDSFSREFSIEREIERMLSELGISTITTPDYATGVASPWAGSFPLNPPGAGAIALPTPPDHWRIRLVEPSQAFFFSPDEFAFSMARDPQLMRQNKTQWFGELFEGLGKNGCAPWFTFDMQLCPNGDRAAGTEPLSCGSPNPLVQFVDPGDEGGATPSDNGGNHPDDEL